MAASATTPLFDVIVIGGGPGGLSVASCLVRQLYTAVVFDSGVYRNARTKHMHNVPGYDHASPADFRAKARADILARYQTVHFQDTKVEKVAKTPDGKFEATDAAGKVWTGRKVVLATGVRDVYPDIKGYDECWGYGIFHCLFCHGYEERGCASAGILAVDDLANAKMAPHLARMAKRIAPNVTIYTNGGETLGSELTAALAGSVTGIKVDNRPIAQLRKGSERAEVFLKFEDGTEVKEGFLGHKPKSEQNGPFAQQLGCELTEQGDLKTVQPFSETTVPGVFAVGDCGTPIKMVPTTIAMGALAAGGLAVQLGMEPF